MAVADHHPQQQAPAAAAAAAQADGFTSVALRSVIPEGRAPAITKRKGGPLAWLTQGQPTNYNMASCRRRPRTRECAQEPACAPR